VVWGEREEKVLLSFKRLFLYGVAFVLFSRVRERVMLINKG
jgi:hypothetical protein